MKAAENIGDGAPKVPDLVKEKDMENVLVAPPKDDPPKKSEEKSGAETADVIIDETIAHSLFLANKLPDPRSTWTTHF